MKNIKFFRYLGLAISAGLLLGFSSCSDDDDYAPGNPVPDNCMGVYFDAGNAAECLIREKVVTFRMVKLNMLLSIFLITK